MPLSHSSTSEERINNFMPTVTQLCVNLSYLHTESLHLLRSHLDMCSQSFHLSLQLAFLWQSSVCISHSLISTRGKVIKSTARLSKLVISSHFGKQFHFPHIQTDMCTGNFHQCQYNLHFHHSCEYQRRTRQYLEIVIDSLLK